MNIRVCEVGPRDGLQGENTHLSVENRGKLVNFLLGSGLDYVEVGSFVNPKAVPAMAQTDAIVPLIDRDSSHRLTAVIFNGKGLEQALAAELTGVCLPLVLTDQLSLKNNRCTVDEAQDRVTRLAKEAKAHGLFVRIDLAPSWVCPYEGDVPSSRVLRAYEAMMESSVDEIALCDTIGWASPQAVSSLCDDIVRGYGSEKLAVHLHDTQGFGVVNAQAALNAGVRIFDASVGGLGGCPFARGARGNLATEDLVLLAKRQGIDTGVNLELLHDVVSWLEPKLGRELGGQTKKFWQSLREEQRDEING